MLRKTTAQLVLVLLSQASVVWAQDAPTQGVDPASMAQSTAQTAGSPPSTAANPQTAPDKPTLQHAPPAIANTGDDFVIHAALTHPEQVRAAVLSYRVTDSAKKDVMFQRSSADDYVAVIPEADLGGELLEYWITLQLVNGTQIQVFNSEQSPHRVQIVPSATDLNEIGRAHV